jgi:hypothetical protein
LLRNLRTHQLTNLSSLRTHELMNLRALTCSDVVLDSLYMPPTQSFDLTVKLKLTPDGVVFEDSETIDYRQRFPDQAENLIGIQGEIILVADSKNHCVGAL